MARLENHSLKAVRQYIEEYFDPDATLRSTDDAAEVLSEMDDLAYAEDGSPTPLSVSHVRYYLDSLKERGR